METTFEKMAEHCKPRSSIRSPSCWAAAWVPSPSACVRCAIFRIATLRASRRGDSVAGHRYEVLVGEIDDVPVVVYPGRIHMYQGYDAL